MICSSIVVYCDVVCSGGVGVLCCAVMLCVVVVSWFAMISWSTMVL